MVLSHPAKAPPSRPHTLTTLGVYSHLLGNGDSGSFRKLALKGIPRLFLAAMLLNDVHSQLNPTSVTDVVRPTTLEALCEVVKQAAREGVSLSVAGARHAMGGQQFATGQRHVDMTGLHRVLHADASLGLLRIEAGPNTGSGRYSN